MSNIVKRILMDAGKLKPVFAHLRRGFSLIVAPHGTGSTVTFDLPANIGVVVFVLVVIFFVGIAFIGITYTKLAVLAVQASKMRAENEVLRAENAKIEEIQAELARIESLKRQIETWAGITEPKSRSSEEAAAADSWTTNFWPRRYTYGIMKPFYAGFASYPEGPILPAEGWVSRGFSAGDGKGGDHQGIDIVVPKGTPVRCALDGRVRSAGWDDVYGNLIVVEHGDTLKTLYGHNDKVLVKEGDRVTKGQVIGLAGSTGKSTAPHVHFEILRKGLPVDPVAYVKAIDS
jgi:murein DD-endopeptidase MepM/ murein hydrolase activator NlpD